MLSPVHITRKQWLSWLLLCLSGVVINSAGSRLAAALGLPLFLDCIGTMLTAVLGGALPGLLVGYLTNLLTSLADPINAYYSTLNALIALTTAAFFQRGWVKKPLGVAGLILSLSMVGGVLGSVITLLLNGFSFGTGISSPFAMWIHAKTGLVPYLSQLLSDIAFDLADKTVAVALVLLVLRFLPKSWFSLLPFQLWQQTPLSDAQRQSLRRVRGRTGTLGFKMLSILMSAMLLIAVASTFISVLQYHRASIRRNTDMGVGVAKLAASIIPAGRVDEYLTLGDAAPGYAGVERQLLDIRDSSPNIQYLYVYRILPDGCHVVFDLDTEDTPGSDPGEIVAFDADFETQVPDLLAGRAVPPLVSHGAFGYLLTAYEPVYDQNGVCQCYAAADISMEVIRSDEIVFVTKVVSIYLGFFLLILALGLWLIEYHITLPINAMSAAAGSFAYNSEDERTGSLQAIRRLNICTGDEIENLYHAISKTTGDMVRYIADVQQKNSTINKMQTGLILVLADLVESRDKCTGDHVRKTAAYTEIILRELRREGKYADTITDEYMEDVFHSAPLHDIGKIHVPDAILNKPGKLTEQEFATMKEHTSSGEEVIDSAIETIGTDAGYLKEARNLAACHHEKWDGTGYPCGLAGEEIPLSARIMAVADVFDALVSRRSYKEPFTIEQALAIIREGSGSHFDPIVAQAFLNAEEEVRKVANRNMMKERLEQEPAGSENQRKANSE